uniref:Uncharacterized protein n=1 Tax=Avena sativa TaxID=4498 RepID=A0ACD5TZ48_AVESA
MTAAAPVAPGSGRLGRPRAPQVGLSAAGVAAAAAGEGPSCLYVGPIETASQERLEALYHQARDSYYSGQPLIVDDMFDKVELKLRVYGSPSVVKYPRCSLKRHSAYGDAEEDHSLFMVLSSIWMLLLLFGTSAFLVPSFYLSRAFGDIFGTRFLLYGTKSLDGITRVNDMVLIGLSYLVGYPIASASFGALQGLLTNNVVALKGSCPNCGEQVFAFVKTDKSIQAPHKAECHVCECPLEYRTKVERSLSGPRRSWVYGRVYMAKQGNPRKRRWLRD